MSSPPATKLRPGGEADTTEFLDDRNPQISMVDDGGFEPPQSRIESLSAFLTRPLIRITLAWILLANIMCGLDAHTAQIIIQILLPLA